MRNFISESKLSVLLKQRNGTLVLAMGLLLIVIFQELTIFSLRHRERIIVIPPVVSQRFWIAHDQVSTNYLVDMTRYFISQLLNVTPEIYIQQLETILPYVDPASYGNLKQKWYQELKRIQHHQISTVFYPHDIAVDRNKLIADVDGELKISAGNAKPISRQLHYQIYYQYRHGKLWISEIKEGKRND